jgi:hypothetical protein
MRLLYLFSLAIVGAIGTATLAMPLHAQTGTSSANSDESHQVPPTLATGVTLGAMRFAGGRTERAMSVLLLYRPLPWLRLSTAPGFARTSLGAVSNSGLTDIPFSAAAVHGFEDVTWSPSIAGAFSATVSPGDSTSVLGLGRSAVEGSAAFTVSPTDRVDVSVDAAHPLLANSGNGSFSLESSMSFGRTTGSLGMSAEVGTPDSAAVLSRALGAGLAYSLSGPLTLTVDASRGLTSSAPTWALSVGLGTAFAGISPLSPTSALKRLRGTLGSKTRATSGYARTANGASACKRAGTC